MTIADVFFTVSTYVAAFFSGWIVCLTVLDTAEHIRKKQ